MSTQTKQVSATPGPWEVHGGKYLPIVAMVKGKPAQIGRAESFGQISDEEVEANGVLIAAAPSLLEALEECTDVLQEFTNILKGERCNLPATASLSKAVLAKAQIAIAKAKERI